MAKLRIVFIGQNGPFTLQPLEAVASRHNLVALIESAPYHYQPVKRHPLRRAAGRVRDWAMELRADPEHPTLRQLAARRRIPYFFMTRNAHSQFTHFLQSVRPDVVCVASMAQLIKKEALAVPRLGTLNVHPSWLPNYRGPAPWFWYYHQMEEEGGVTVHYIDEGEDSGNILRQAKYPIPLGMEFPSMLAASSQLGASLLVEALEDVEAGAPGTPQKDLPCPFRARRFERDEPLIDWVNWPIKRVWHVLRGTRDMLQALPPPPGAGPGVSWRIGEYQSVATQGIPGTVERDEDGAYAIHAEGKIRLLPDTPAPSRAPRLASRLLPTKVVTRTQ